MLAQSFLLCGVGILLFGLLLMHFLSRPMKFPPGPLRLPIIGSILLINLPVQEGSLQLFNYGPMFSVYFGNYPKFRLVVVLCDLTLIRDAFKNEKFCGRPSLRPMRDLSYLKDVAPLGVGLVRSWSEQRRFALRALVGFYKNSMEDIIMEEIHELMQGFKDHRYWRDPNVFRPDRFMSTECKLVKPETVIPFSMGKSVCPVAALARDQLFLFFGAIFQQPRIGVDPNQPPNAAMEPNHGIISKPKVLLKLRNIADFETVGNGLCQ